MGFFSSIGSTVSSAWDATTDAVSDAWDATADAAEDAWEETKDWADSTWEDAQNVAEDKWGDLEKWSEDAAKGEVKFAIDLGLADVKAGVDVNPFDGDVGAYAAGGYDVGFTSGHAGIAAQAEFEDWNLSVSGQAEAEADIFGLDLAGSGSMVVTVNPADEIGFEGRVGVSVEDVELSTGARVWTDINPTDGFAGTGVGADVRLSHDDETIFGASTDLYTGSDHGIPGFGGNAGLQVGGLNADIGGFVGTTALDIHGGVGVGNDYYGVDVGYKLWADSFTWTAGAEGHGWVHAGDDRYGAGGHAQAGVDLWDLKAWTDARAEAEWGTDDTGVSGSVTLDDEGVSVTTSQWLTEEGRASLLDLRERLPELRSELARAAESDEALTFARAFGIDRGFAVARDHAEVATGSALERIREQVEQDDAGDAPPPMFWERVRAQMQEAAESTVDEAHEATRGWFRSSREEPEGGFGGLFGRVSESAWEHAREAAVTGTQSGEGPDSGFLPRLRDHLTNASDAVRESVVEAGRRAQNEAEVETETRMDTWRAYLGVARDRIDDLEGRLGRVFDNDENTTEIPDPEFPRWAECYIPPGDDHLITDGCFGRPDWMPEPDSASIEIGQHLKDLNLQIAETVKANVPDYDPPDPLDAPRLPDGWSEDPDITSTVWRRGRDEDDAPVDEPADDDTSERLPDAEDMEGGRMPHISDRVREVAERTREAAERARDDDGRPTRTSARDRDDDEDLREAEPIRADREIEPPRPTAPDDEDDDDFVRVKTQETVEEPEDEQDEDDFGDD